ncbi:MAG: molybdopterin cofactor-binding domain-containing protein [Pseudomonadota bacterium]
MNALTPDRRQFLAASGLVLGLALPARGVAAAAAATPFQANAFVRIAPDDTVTIIIKHIEFGQGPATGISTIIADELDADWSQVRIEFAPANDPLYKNLAFGTMGTGGSTAIAASWMQARIAGASARAMLVAAAAKRWGVPAAEVTVAKGVVRHGRNRASFGELAAEAATLPAPTDPKLKTPEQFTLIGTDLTKVDSRTKSDGTAQFTMDVARPGMVHTAIAHAPAFGGTVTSFDPTAALAVPGVLAVERVPQGVIVFASDTWSAMRGRNALVTDWDLSKAEKRSSEAMIADYRTAAATPGAQAHKAGDVAAGLAGATKTLEAEYVFPFLAHAPMEPMDAVIERSGDRVDVWMGSQFQVGEMSAIAATLGVKPDQVRLHEQYAGGSFGRRATPAMEFAVEAACAHKAWGKGPVKHVWSRENDLQGGRYRPLGIHRLKGGIDAAGKIVAWDQVLAFQSFVLGTPMEKMAAPSGVDETMFEGNGLDDYAIANGRVGYHVMPNGVPTLWWRSVGHTHTAYASETFYDRLLALGGVDPVAGRLAQLKDPRAKGVLTRVAELTGWGKSVPAGRARGVAVHKSFNTYVAQVAEVSRGSDGLPRVHKVWCAVDCGIAVNPNVIRAQMEGGIGFALGHALYAEVTLGEGGQVEQSNFDRYRSLRMAEMPDIEVAIIKSAEKPTGVGEPGVPPAAPAVANAWRALTGQSVTRLPFAHISNRVGASA